MSKSQEAQHLLRALDAELAVSAKRSGRDLAWSAAERDVLAMIGEAVDRRVELSAAYQRPRTPLAVKLKIATELRLTEQAIARLYRQVSTDLPSPLSVTSQKAQRAAHSRWDRERMRNSAN